MAAKTLSPEAQLLESKAADKLYETGQIAGAGKLTMLDIDALGLEGNVRTPQTELIPQMVESIKANGFKTNHPLVVSQRDDGRQIVLCGNRRTKAVFWIRDNAPEDFARIFPKGKIPAVVHKGLNAEQETLIRIDHGSSEDRVRLDDLGEFLAVKQLVAVGHDTQGAIALKLDKYKKGPDGQPIPDRSWAQTRVNLAKLPKAIQDEFAKLWTAGKDSTPFRVGDINKVLMPAYNADLKAGFAHGDGPEFGKAVDSIRAAADESTGAPKAGNSAMSAKQMESASTGCNSKLGKELLLLAAGKLQGGKTLADIDNAILEAETGLDTVRVLERHHGAKEFRTMVRQARSEAAAVEAPAPEAAPA